MPKGKYIRTLENRRNIGLTKIGNKNMVGRHHSEITKKKLSLSRKKYVGVNHPLFGKHLSEKTRKKISAALKGVSRPDLAGKFNPAWKGGISTEHSKIRNSIEYKLWRDSVFARDGYTCQKYQTKSTYIVAHHILNFAQWPELRFAIDNGITLSEKAHKEFHKKYGKSNNNRQQLEEFLTC